MTIYTVYFTPSNLKKLFFSLSFVLMFFSVGYCQEAIPDVNDFFIDGDYRDIEVMFPKPGFVGARHPPIAMLFRKKVPSSKDDFLYKYVRITIVKKIKFNDSIRIVLRLDEIDPNGVFVKRYGGMRNKIGYHKPLHYAYFDVKPSGCEVVGYVSSRGISIPNHKEPGELRSNILNTTSGSGIKFPLISTLPPALNSHENYKDNSWMHKVGGVVYTDATRLDAPYYMKIHSSLLLRVFPSMKVKQQDIRYYSVNDKTLSKAKKTNSIEVIISAKETQLWGKFDDWLWESMTRTDAKGNITMRCKQLKK